MTQINNILARRNSCGRLRTVRQYVCSKMFAVRTDNATWLQMIGAMSTTERGRALTQWLGAHFAGEAFRVVLSTGETYAIVHDKDVANYLARQVGGTVEPTRATYTTEEETWKPEPPQ